MTNSIKLISVVCSVAVAYLVAVLWQNSSNSCGRPQVMEPLPPNLHASTFDIPPPPPFVWTS
jgi:hypothetical protein